jgi:citrate synthase
MNQYSVEYGMAMVDEPAFITAAEAAARLGVRPATLYAYVSRGIVRSHRLPGQRGSWFDPRQIDGVAGGRRRTDRGETGESVPAVTVATALTRIGPGSLAYRGHDVVALSRTASFESVARLLWTGALEDRTFEAPAAAVKAARQATRWLPAGARLPDRLGLVIVAAGAVDPLRFDLSPAAVASTGQMLIATMAEALPAATDHAPPAPTVAARLWTRLAPGRPPRAAASALNGFLVLTADHELATSTLAARVAASARANPYAAVLAAFGAMEGPLHGSVSEEVHRLLVEAAGPPGPTAAVADRLRRGMRIPGFGHFLYRDGDPRAAAGMELVRRLAHDGATRDRLKIVDQVHAAVTARTPAAANVDFGLGALTFVAGMPADAGEAIFILGRTAGWLAHTIEEYDEPPLRFRTRAIYTGPPARAD